MNIRKAISVMMGTLGVAFMATSAHAVLPPGQVLVPVLVPGTSAVPGVVGPPPVTVLLADETNPVLFAAGVTPTFGGKVESTVYSDATGLLFEYQFTANATPTDTVVTLSPGVFFGPIAVGQAGAATGAAQVVSYKSTGTVSFQGFNLLQCIPPGTSSDILYIQTTSTAFTNGSAGLSDNVGGTAGVYVPAPEPSSIAAFVVMGLGILALAVRARRRTVSMGQMA